MILLGTRKFKGVENVLFQVLNNYLIFYGKVLKNCGRGEIHSVRRVSVDDRVTLEDLSVRVTLNVDKRGKNGKEGEIA